MDPHHISANVCVQNHFIAIVINIDYVFASIIHISKDGKSECDRENELFF